MAAPTRTRLIPTLGLLMGATGMMGCSNPLQDVRVTLCRDIVVTQLGSSQAVSVKGTETEIRGREYAAIKVQFSTAGGDGQAVCYFKHEAPEETAMTVSDPLSAFATSPYRVTLGGQTLSGDALAEAIKNAMLKQGKELVDRAKELADRAKKGLQ